MIKTIKITAISICAIISISLMLLVSAKSPSELAADNATEYIASSLSDENWSGSHPYISGSRSYSTDADDTAYIEYKVSCDEKPSCGWIIVNVDGDDVTIPVASTE